MGRVFVARAWAPKRGRLPKNPEKRAKRLAQLREDKAYAKALSRQSGFARSIGRRRKGKVLDHDSPEFAEVAARYGLAPKGDGDA